MTAAWNTDRDMSAAQAKAEHASQDAVRWAVRDALLAAPHGLTNVELFARFGPSAVKRLNDLKRHHGYEYSREYVGARTYRYRLTVTRPAPGTPGYLASLPAVNDPRPDAAAPAPPPEGWLFS